MTPNVTDDPPMTTAPAIVRAANPLLNRLMRLGLPLGPNRLLTVAGRSTGIARTAPVAVAEIDGSWWVIGAYGEVHWVRNLRAAGRAEIRLDGKVVPVMARELARPEAVRFFRDALPAYAARLPWLFRFGVRALFRVAAPEILTDPERAAATRPVFELRVA